MRSNHNPDDSELEYIAREIYRHDSWEDIEHFQENEKKYFSKLDNLSKSLNSIEDIQDELDDRDFETYEILKDNYTMLLDESRAEGRMNNGISKGFLEGMLKWGPEGTNEISEYVEELNSKAISLKEDYSEDFDPFEDQNDEVETASDSTPSQDPSPQESDRPDENYELGLMEKTALIPIKIGNMLNYGGKEK